MPHEAFRERSAVPEEEPNQQPASDEDLVSRRDLLRGAGGLVASLLAPRKSGHAEEAPSSSEGATEYAEGLKRLQHEAIYSDREHPAIYQHLPDGKGRWEFQEIGGQSHAYIGTPESIAAKLNESESLESSTRILLRSHIGMPKSLNARAGEKSRGLPCRQASRTLAGRYLL